MPYDLSNKKQVFINWDLIEPGYGVRMRGQDPTSWELPIGIKLSVHRPRMDYHPFIASDHAWEATIIGDGTWFEDEGRYRLYYEVFDPDVDLGGTYSTASILAYAESTDGIHWVKPTVGALNFRGSAANNLVYGRDLSLGRGSHGTTVFKDPNARPDQRYKLVHMAHEGDRQHVHGAVSPDGLRWRPMAKPLLTDYMSDTQTVMAFDPDRGRYVGYFRGWEPSWQRGLHGRRVISYAETEDFENWPTPQIIVRPDLHDTPSTDIYTSSYTRWPGAANAHLMFPAFYERHLDIAEVHMLTSRDGLAWDRLSRQPIVPVEEPGAYRDGSIYAGQGLVSLEPGYWSLLIAPSWDTHNQKKFRHLRPAVPPHRGYLCRAIWRQDGFTSLSTDTEGRCTTFPITFSGRHLEVNAWTIFGGEVRFELATVSGDVLPGRSLAECDPITGDALKHTVTWGGQSDVSAWAGQPIRLRIAMRRARLHAIQFV